MPTRSSARRRSSKRKEPPATAAANVDDAAAAAEPTSKQERVAKSDNDDEDDTTTATEQQQQQLQQQQQQQNVLELYRKLATTPTDDRDTKRRLLGDMETQGLLMEQIWPTLIATHKNQSKNNNNNNEVWKAACHLLAAVVSWTHRLGQSFAVLQDFWSVILSGKHVEVWNDCIDTLYCAGQTMTTMTTSDSDIDWDSRTVMTHFLTVAWSVTSSSSTTTTTTTSPQQALWLPLGASLTLWEFMPAWQRELQLRQRDWLDEFNKLEKQQETKQQQKSKSSPPFVVQLIQQVLNLVQGDALKLGKVRPRIINTQFFQTGKGREWGLEENVGTIYYENSDDDDDEDNDDDDDDQEGKKVAGRPAEEAREKLQQWTFLHRSLELLIDLLSSLQTRRYLAPYLESLHFSIQCRFDLGTSTYSRADENLFLAQQLLERVTRLLHFPYDSKENRVLSPVEQRNLYHRRAMTLQKMCHRYYADQVPDLIYAGVGLLCNGTDFLRQALGGLQDAQLLELLQKMRLVDQKKNGGPETYSRDFLVAVLQDYLTLPNDPIEELQSFPLYPTEAALWDFSKIPPSQPTLLPASFVLSLPKLQTSFMSPVDYLGRNFELTSRESAYEIRADLVDVIRRLRPLLRQVMSLDASGNEVTVLETEFAGWARMALELDGKLEIKKVDKPLLGEKHPAQVVAEITVDLGPCGDAIRREWDDLGEFDNLFLVAIDASKMTGNQAPLLRDYHLEHGTHRRWDSDGDRRVPDADDRTFPERYGVTLVRGCMILHVHDEEGKIVSDPSSAEVPTGNKRIFRVALDPTQYSSDLNLVSGADLYQQLNLVVRRRGRENNFKAVLQTIRGLMAGSGSISRAIPPWLQPLLLGEGDPKAAYYKSDTMQAYARKTVGVANPDDPLDFGDTFLNEEHLRASFVGAKVVVDGRDTQEAAMDEGRRNYRIRIFEKGSETIVDATSYPFPEEVKGNPVPFTPVQVEAIRSGLSPGLTVVVGPPGTGKTDVSVQIIASLYHSFPTQRTIVITHSNAALNDIFQKVMARGDVDERYLLRLGAGERDLQTESTHDFTKIGRVAYSLARRGKLLEEVQLLSESLGVSGKAERGDDGSPSYTCETASYFNENHVQKQIRSFEQQAANDDNADVHSFFPFSDYFKTGDDTISLSQARVFFSRLKQIFDELSEYRPLELLRSQRQRADYLIMKQARVVAMTCTHAAIARSHLIELGFEYDNMVVEEAGQMTEIESFIPLLLQKGEIDESSSGTSRLKRVCLMGDHHQLPPIIKNASFSNYSNLDQSLFTRLIRFGVPYVQLDRQGRSRPEIASLYSWRYDNLGNLDRVECGEYQLANPGFVNTFQVINVDMYEGKGETTPTPYFYQNMGEAEYAVALFQYMVLIGYPPQKISILTTYNGQKELISDILSQRCGEGTPLAGVRPLAVSTVDQYQGQQNDYVLLSLVRTESVGHLRDIRRLVVAVSRARLGLYVFCRQELFAACHDLKPTFDQFAQRPNKLQLVLNENYPTERRPDDKVPKDKLFEVEDVTHLGSVVFKMQEEWMQSQS